NLATSTPGTYTVFNDIAASGSCAAAQNSTSITISALPSATVTGGGSQCGNATPIDVTVVLSGTGPWDLVVSNGTGSTNVSGQTTSPLIIPVTVSGTYTVTSVTANGCSASGTGSAVVTFSNGPTPTISPVNSLCSNAGAITLVASPSGGTFTGTGVAGTQFNPASAAVGSNDVSYSVTDGNGCTGSTSVSIVVTAAPNVSITPVNDICNNASTVTLAATPVGGTFSGTGVTGGQFNPVQAPGDFNVYYSYTDGNGCTGNAGTAITVLASPTASLSAFSPICLQDGAITLSGGAPQNGVYSGNGVTGNQFNPSVSGAGTITIDYTYTASNGCSDNATNTITVNDCAGIDEIASINALIAPNPASDELTITINSELNNVVYSMVSEDGKVVIPATSINTAVTNINVNQLAEGLYFIQLSNANGIAVKKVIIK
ncbi:MAG: T9SS type A sorting domain-containing protein, partial [Flavobacteriia bacterium]